MSRKLYVGNLPYETDEAALETLFASAGAVGAGSRGSAHWPDGALVAQ